MLRQALALWKQERHKGTPLQRRLFAFFACMAAFLILVFVTLILLFNINGSGTPAVRHFIGSELSHLNSTVSTDFGRLAVQGVSFSETLVRQHRGLLFGRRLGAADFRQLPDRIEPLLREQCGRSRQ